MPFQPSNTDSEKLQYLLTVLKHTETFKPNFDGVAEEVGLSRKDKARDKLKSQLQNTGFVLLKEGRIAEIGHEDMPSSPAKASPKKQTPKKQTPKKKGTAGSAASEASASKKRKLEAMEEEEEEEDDDDDDDDENGNDVAEGGFMAEEGREEEEA